MRAVLGVLSLLIVLAVVGGLAKKQLGVDATPQQQSQQIQQQVKQSIEAAIQNRPVLDNK
jgi:hypothetical protein